MQQCVINPRNEMKIPKWIVLQLLEKCNLRCRMCYEWGTTGSYHGKESLKLLDVQAIKDIVKACEPVHPYYELFGGEPLMYPNAAEVIYFIREHGSNVDMATNGVLLEKNAQMLIDAGLSRLWVSMDGPEEINDFQRGKNTYKNAVAGIEKILGLRKGEFPKVGVTTIVTPGNHLYIEEFFFNLVSKYNIDHISIEFETFATKNQYSDYKNFIEQEFNASDASAARGLVHDLEEFRSVDTKKLLEQMLRIKDYCMNNGIKFFNNPCTIDACNYESYFSGKWEQMTDRKTKCPFAWVHAEVTARGNVTMCHVFNDLYFGNIYNETFLEIWNNEKSRKFRNILKKRLLPMCTACSRYFTQTHNHG